MLRCNICKKVKEENFFSKDSSNKYNGGFSYQCKQCKKIYMKKYREGHKEYYKNYCKEWRKRNPNYKYHDSSWWREYRQKNVEKLKAYRNEWYKKRKLKIEK